MYYFINGLMDAPISFFVSLTESIITIL